MVSISSNIRRRIKMTSKRLVEAMKESTAFSAVPSLSMTTDRDKLDELKDRLLDLVTYKDRIGTSLSVIYECSRDWTNGIETLDERERQEELKLQAEFCQDENGDYVLLLDQAQELVDNLKLQEAALTKVIRALEKKVELAAAKATGAPTATLTAPGAAAASLPPQVNLPMMDLPQFEGDVLKFSEFWDLFEATIDKNTVLGDRQKFSYLKTYLRGRAERLIEGLSVTEGNYRVAKELLKNSYCKKDYVVQALYRELEQLRKPLSNAASLRAFLQELEKLCRQLEQLGEDLDQKQILVNLESKMPLNVLSEIAKAKNSGGTWTTKELREILKRAVELQETIESMSGVSVEEKGSTGRRRVERVVTVEEDEPKMRPSAAFTVRRGNRPPSCVYCSEQHYASDCKKYVSVAERMEFLREQRRCFKCCMQGHRAGECRSPRPCYYCQQISHNSSLCRSKEEKQGINSRQKEDEARAMAAACEEEKPGSTDDFINTLGFEPADEPVWVRTNTLRASVTKCVSGGNPKPGAALLTAHVTVSNDGTKQHRAAALLDNASEVSWISLRLAKSLGLAEIGRGEVALTTLTTKHPQKLECPEFELSIMLDDGAQKSITAYGKEELIGTVPVSSVVPLNKRAPDENKWIVITADYEPQLIIGADYYWELEVRRIHEMASGAVILASELGFMAAGKIMSDSRITDESEDTDGARQREEKTQADVTATTMHRRNVAFGRSLSIGCIASAVCCLVMLAVVAFGVWAMVAAAKRVNMDSKGPIDPFGRYRSIHRLKEACVEALRRSCDAHASEETIGENSEGMRRLCDALKMPSGRNSINSRRLCDAFENIVDEQQKIEVKADHREEDDSAGNHGVSEPFAPRVSRKAS